MKWASILVTMCLGLAAASPKRQASPDPPTPPPMMNTTMDVQTMDNMSTPNASEQPTTDGAMVSMVTTDAPNMTTTQSQAGNTTSSQAPTTEAVTMADTTEAVTIAVTTPQTAQSTDSPVPSKIVGVDEIVTVFGEVANSDYYKRLPYEDQLLVLEILAGGEVGKMTAILNQIGYEHLFRFMYDLPLKYQDDYYAFIAMGFAREKLSLNMN